MHLLVRISTNSIIFLSWSIVDNDIECFPQICSERFFVDAYLPDFCRCVGLPSSADYLSLCSMMIPLCTIHSHVHVFFSLLLTTSSEFKALLVNLFFLLILSLIPTPLTNIHLPLSKNKKPSHPFLGLYQQ